MIDLQYVVLYVSSFVILFHRGRKSGRRKNGKVRGKSKEKHRIKKAEKGRAHTNGKPQGKKKRQERHETDKGENRIMQSCERAVFSPRFLVPLYKTGRRFLYGRCVDGVIHWDIKHGKIPPSDCFLSCPMRRRSLRLLSPGRLHNSDGDTGTFFRVKKLPQGIFLPENRRPNVEGIVPPGYLLEGT